MGGFRDRFVRFMSGRYGPDQFNMFLIVSALVISMLLSIFGLGFLSFITYIPLFYSIFRIFSRNIEKRRAENAKFLRYWTPIKTKISRRFSMLRQSKQYKFFRCPTCGEYARVPKKIGTVDIRCRKCGNKFRKKA